MLEFDSLKEAKLCNVNPLAVTLRELNEFIGVIREELPTFYDMLKAGFCKECDRAVAIETPRQIARVKVSIQFEGEEEIHKVSAEDWEGVKAALSNSK